MLDVHPPHEAVHGWRDIVLHVFVMTIGLFIALSLEGCVEWQHHRHLVHEAKSSLQNEIKGNAANLAGTAEYIRQQQEALKHDVAVLTQMDATGKAPAKDSMQIAFQIKTFRSVAWRTAQSTGALAYMPYGLAQDYADIYSTQEELYAAQQQAARDTVISLGPFANSPPNGDLNFTKAENASIRASIETVQGQLLLVSALVDELNDNYKKFLAAHPDGD